MCQHIIIWFRNLVETCVPDTFVEILFDIYIFADIPSFNIDTFVEVLFKIYMFVDMSLYIILICRNVVTNYPVCVYVCRGRTPYHPATHRNTLHLSALHLTLLLSGL